MSIITTWTNTLPMPLKGMAGYLAVTAVEPFIAEDEYDICVCTTCDYEETAFVNNGGEWWKNDYKSIIAKRKFASDTVTFKLLLNDVVVATLNASTYGTYYNFGDTLFADFPDYKGFICDWNLVRIAFGYGKYKLRVEIVSLGTTYTKDTHTFNVVEYNAMRACGTVRIESYQNGNLTKHWDYTGLNWPQCTRIEGFFGNKKPTLIIDQYEDFNRQVHEIQGKIEDTYYLNTQLLQSEVFNYLNYNGLRGNTVLITDYNLRNQELYRRKSVYLSNFEDITNHMKTKVASFYYAFKAKINNDLKRNLRGDYGILPYRSGGSIGCADATVELNGVFYNTVASGGTLDVISTQPTGVYFKVSCPDQYTSFRTGDVGWRVQNGYYPVLTQPTYPEVFAELDYTSADYWYKLKNALVVNGVSSTTRFVDVAGVQTFSATGNKDYAVLDKLTGLLFKRKTNDPPSDTWNNQIDLALAESIVIDGTTYADWYLASLEELLQITGTVAVENSWVDPVTTDEIAQFVSGYHWTSSTNLNDTTMAQAVRIYTSGSHAIIDYKTTNYRPFWVHKAHNLITAP